MKSLLVFFTISLALTSTAFADTGVIKWFSLTKGYGFIIPDKSGSELYFDYTFFLNEAETNDLESGDCVRYVKEQSATGKIQAINIARIRCD